MMFSRPYSTRSIASSLRHKLPLRPQPPCPLPLKGTNYFAACHTVPTYLAPSQNRSPACSNSRPFTSNSARPAPEGPRTVLRSINGEDWEKVSAEAKIKWINQDEKWGWVVYRCSYAKELEPAWEKAKRTIVEGLRREIAESDTPSIADTMDFVFIEDPSLEGASIEQLQQHFQAWARANCDWDFPEGDLPEISRFQFFLKADAELFRRDDLVLVHGWRHDPEEEEQENWIMIAGDAVSTNLYISSDNSELWYMYYTLPGSYANVY